MDNIEYKMKVAFDEFKLFYDSTEKVTDRRLEANRWNYSICVATLGAIATIISWSIDKPEFLIMGLATIVLLAGMASLYCTLWIGQIRDLKELNNAKFSVLNEMAPFVAFGDDAHPIELKDIPYLQAGPFHTNTVAALEMAMDVLKRRKNPNKQIFMITDGKPTCIKQGHSYYKNPFGLDKKIINQTLTLAARLRKLKIPVTTFMITSDPYLKAFVREFTRINKGNAYFSNIEGLGELVFEDFNRNRVKHF